MVLLFELVRDAAPCPHRDVGLAAAMGGFGEIGLGALSNPEGSILIVDARRWRLVPGTNVPFSAGWSDRLAGSNYDWYFRSPDGETHDGVTKRLEQWLEANADQTISSS